MTAAGQPKALVVYFTLSQQTGRVAQAVEHALAEKGYDVTGSAIEFIDPHWTKVLTGVPMRRPALNIPRILVAQRRRKTGEIRIPEEAMRGDYDLVVIGSPTWWLTTNMPIRSYLQSPEAKTVLDGKPFAAFSVSRRYWKGNMHDLRELGEANGGRWLGETHFLAAGGQVKSMLSWLGYMKHGEPQERMFGMTMPPPNLKAGFEDQARLFVDRVAIKSTEHQVVPSPAG